MSNVRTSLRRAFAAAALATLSATLSVAGAAGLQATNDLKVYAFLVKKEGISDDEFHSHWREPHGRLTKKVPQINRYVQNHGVDHVPTVPGLAPTSYLGIPAIWVASLEKLNAIYTDPGFQEVHEDELNILQRDKLAWLITREYIVAAGPSADDISYRATKAMLFLKRRVDVRNESFRVAIADFAKRTPKIIGSGRITYAFPVSEAYQADAIPLFDAVVELAYASDAAWQKSWARSGKELLNRFGAVVDRQASRGFLAHEERVIWPP